MIALIFIVLWATLALASTMHWSHRRADPYPAPAHNQLAKQAHYLG